jgi:hypothetical protein
MVTAINPLGLDPDLAALMFESWLLKLSEDSLGFSSHSAGGTERPRRFTSGDPTGPHFVVEIAEDLVVTLTECVEVEQAQVRALIDNALARVAAHDLGGTVVYGSDMEIQTLDIGGDALIHFMRILGDQVHIEGPRRLSDVAILDFQEGLLADAPTGALLFAPSKVQVWIFAKGPTASDLTSRAATGAAEVIAAICAFATGRPVRFTVPMFPVDEEKTLAAIARQTDPNILGLARDGVSLDIFGDLAAVGGPDATLRARGSLLAFHAALHQTSPDVAVMLLITSVEALISPRATWGKTRVTQRFITALIELCPEAVDEMVNHLNVGQAFGFSKRGGVRRQRRELLTLIYDARSLPTHTGLGLTRTGLFDLGSGGSMRVALLSDLARAALLNYLQAPRSWIIGQHEGSEGAV